MRKDKNGAGDNIFLNAKPDVNSNIDLVKLEEVEKRVGTIMKSSSYKIANLKLLGSFVANCLVSITPLENPILIPLIKPALLLQIF